MIIVVTGTGTEVGKTWFTAATIARLRAGDHAVSARKPVQSFAPDDPTPTDAEALARATGEAPEVVCPRHRWLPMAVAPPMAAAALGRAPFTIAELTAEMRAGAPFANGTVPRECMLFVEGAGGARSPIADDGDTVALAHAMTADEVVIVADAGLGTINAVRLTVSALSSWSPIVALNRYDEHDDLHRANRAWLTERDGFAVVTAPEALGEMLRRRGMLPNRS